MRRLIALLAPAILCLAACGSDSDGTTPPTKYYPSTFTHEQYDVPSRAVISRSNTSYSYDDLNRTLVSIMENDTNADGTIDSLGTATVVDNGADRFTSTYEQDSDANGTIDRCLVTFRQYNDNGIRSQFLTISYEEDSNCDGVDDIRITGDLTQDEQGHILTYTLKFDTDADGVPDRWTYSTAVYDLGRLQSETIEQDLNADDTIDSRTTQFYTYDSQGNWISEVKEEDTNADGTPESISWGTHGYDADGHRTISIYRQDTDADNIVDTESTSTYTYSSALLLNSLLITHYTDPGMNDFYQENTYAYDADNFLTGQQILNGYGTNFSRQDITMTNDNTGNQLTMQEDVDFGNDGVIDVQDGSFSSYQILTGDHLDQMFYLAKTSY